MEETTPEEFIWNKPFYEYQGQPFLPVIWDGIQASTSAGFNAVTLTLDGRLKADLNWKEAREQAQHYVTQGYVIFWQMNLGLFADLTMPLTHQAQYLSLGLSLEHFRDTLWQEFKDHTIGLQLYRGNADFSLHFPWNDQQVRNLQAWLTDRLPTLALLEQETGLHFAAMSQVDPASLSKSESGLQLIRLFCRDVAVEYIALLASRLPDALARYLVLNAKTIQDPLYQAQVLHPERFEHFGLAIKGTSLPLQSLGWNQSSPYGILAGEIQRILPLPDSKIGVCLPSMDLCQTSHYQGIREALTFLIDKKIPFRLIPEAHLITEWDGLDYILYTSAGLGPQGKRKLQGFCAAGGTGVALTTPIGLPQEIFLPDLMKIYC